MSIRRYSMDKTTNKMALRPVFPLLISMSLPVIFSMLIQSLYNLVDSFWVAKLGTDALTAVSLAFPLQNCVMSVGVGAGIGVGSQVSMSLGSGSQDDANRAASLGIVLSIIHGFLFVLIGLFCTESFLAAFTKDGNVLALATDYTQIVLCFAVGNMVQMCYEKIFQGAGKMTTTMFLMAFGCIVNIVLDPIMIFGLLGFPALGIRGAAYATVIGQFGGMLLYMIVYPFVNLGISINPFRSGYTQELAKKIYGVAIPSCLMLTMPSFLTGILNAILVRIGEVYVAILGLYFKLQTFVFMPANGVIQGMRPIIGYNYGAKSYRRVKQAIGFSLLLVALISAVGTILAVFFPQQILQLFDPDPVLLQEGSKALFLIGPSFLISTVSVVVCGVLEALGEGKKSLSISLFRQLLFLVPLGWLLSNYMGATGIWIAFPIAELITLFFAVRYLKNIFCKQLCHEEL